jgi:MFS family permease
MLNRREEFARGWRVLLSATLGSGTGVAPLAFYSLGALVKPLSHEFGWTRAEVTGASLALSIGMLAMGTTIGGIADRYGARRVAILSQVVLAALFAAMTLVDARTWTLYVGYFALGGLGAGTLPITWSRAVTGWFVRSRGLALGLSLVGTGVVGMLLPTYVTWLAGAFGWRGAFLGIAALPVVVGMPCALLYFREPEERPAAGESKVQPGASSAPWGVPFTEALRRWRFWQMSTAFFIAAVVIGGINVNALPLLTDRGIERGTAAAIAGLIGAMVAIGRLISGYLLDVFPGPRVAFVMLGAPAAASVLLAVSGNNLMLCGVAILLIGLAAGAEHDIAAYFAARYFGRRHFGAIYGLLYTLYTFGAGVGPPLAGAVFDRTGSYVTALYGGAALFLLAAAFVGTLGAYPRESRSG